MYVTMPVASAASSGRCWGSTPNSPSTLGAVSSSTASFSLAPSGVTISRAMVAAISGRLRSLQLGCCLLGFFDVADHVEGLLGQVVEGAGQNLLEARDRLFERHVLAGAARELLSHEERLRQEALDLAGARHGGAVVFAQLVHTENGDDVLQVFVLLQGLLHLAGDRVVLLADDVG